MIVVYIVLTCIFYLLGAICAFALGFDEDMFDDLDSFKLWSFFVAAGTVLIPLWPVLLVLALPALVIYGLTAGAKQFIAEVRG